MSTQNNLIIIIGSAKRNEAQLSQKHIIKSQKGCWMLDIISQNYFLNHYHLKP